MPAIAESDVLARLLADDPWWAPDFRAEGPPCSRPCRAFADRVKELVLSRVRRAVVLLGARRVGKTTLLPQILGDCLDRFPALLHAALDTPTYAGLSSERLLALFARAKPHDPSAARLVVFDEIQHLRDWEIHLEDLVDRFLRTKFVVSGSAGGALRRRSPESGVGRFTDVELPPPTFAEFLDFNGTPLVEVDGTGALPVFRTRDIAALAGAFRDYLAFGGCPEAVLDPQIREGSQRFSGRDIVDEALLRDLPVLYGITDVTELNRLFTVLACDTGREAGLEALASGSGIAKPTIERYLDYLEAAFLTHRLRRIDVNARRFERERGFEVHLVNPAMRAAPFGPIEEVDERFGALVESGVLGQWPHLPERGLARYARWKGPRGDLEVDLVTLHGSDQRPRWALEVEWSDRPLHDAREYEGLAALRRRHVLVAVGVTTRTGCA